VSSELERALAFLEALERRVSTRAEPLAFGTAHFHDRLPRVWDRNYLLVERDPGELEPLLAAGERLQGAAGLFHRSFHFHDEGAGHTHAPQLADRGFTIRRLLVMAARYSSAHPGAETAVEVDHATLRTAREAYLATELFGRDPETARQLLANDDVVAAAAGERCFAVRNSGEVVSYCRLYGEGATMQIEDVATLPEHRGRGHASAVVSAAAAAARAAGADLVFLLADENEPAKEIYRRLRFETVGRTVEAIRAALATP
jgi:ribosomal protein S18 acetylase RimI-like enzyme